MTSLEPPFPYFGSKRRLASAIWEKLGQPTVYVEPFAGSLACLLSRPGGAGQREIVCDLDSGISNFWRAVEDDPDAVAYWADYPSIHQDLTARHKWLNRWIVENAQRMSEDPHYYDAKAAGWWVWGISLWIGGGWCSVNWEERPYADAKGGGRGTSAQRIDKTNQRPHINNKGGGLGVSAQSDKMPHVSSTGGGQGISAQRRAGQMPYVKTNSGGQGVSAQRTQRAHDQIPHVNATLAGRGVSAQRRTAPDGSAIEHGTPDKRPHVKPHPGGVGVNAQVLNAPDKRPHANKSPVGQGVAAQRRNTPDKIPWLDSHGGGRGVAAQKEGARDKRPHVDDRGGGRGVSKQRRNTSGADDRRPGGVNGSRIGGRGASSQRTTRPDLVVWFRAIQERLKGVIVLNRSWQSALTPTLLMHTPTSPKPPVGILMDPPYLTGDRQSELYGSDADGTSDSVAEAAYRWATGTFENEIKGYHGIPRGEMFRIAYCCHEGDFPVPEGWTTIESTFGGIRVKANRSKRDLIMFSPACIKNPQLSFM